MRRETNTQQMKEQGKNPPDQTRENRQSTWKGIQSNDSKNDPKSWKYNRENTRNV